MLRARLFCFMYSFSSCWNSHRHTDGRAMLQDFCFSSRRRHTISLCDWSSDVCSSDLMTSPGRSRPAYGGSTRRDRLPDNWAELRAEAKRLNPTQICHVCGLPGGTTLDHKVRGDDHRQENL